MRHLWTSLLLSVLLLAVSASAESYEFTADSFFSRPATVITWRCGAGFGEGTGASSELRSLVQHRLEAVRVLGDVYPNLSVVDMVWMSFSLNYDLLEREPQLNDIVSLGISFGAYFKGFHLRWLGDVTWYAGPSLSIVEYFYSPDRRLFWYSDGNPQFGILPGAEAGAELFFSPMLSCFVQAKYQAGKVEAWWVETYGSGTGGPDLIDYAAPHRRLGLFELTAGVRFYFGQNLGWTPAGLAER
jgi:hypothetical protein